MNAAPVCVRVALLAAVSTVASSVLAQARPGGAGAAASSVAHPVAPAAARDGMTGAQVRRIDRQARRITLKHEAIEDLGMAGMTMGFRVRDAAVLDAVKPGDKVRFRAERAGGSLWVTALEAAP